MRRICGTNLSHLNISIDHRMGTYLAPVRNYQYSLSTFSVRLFVHFLFGFSHGAIIKLFIAPWVSRSRLILSILVSFKARVKLSCRVYMTGPKETPRLLYGTANNITTE